MKTVLATRYVDIPKEIELEVNSRVVTVKGPRGELSQSFKHLKLDMQKTGHGKLRVDLWFGNRKQVSVSLTIIILILCFASVAQLQCSLYPAPFLSMYGCLVCGVREIVAFARPVRSVAFVGDESRTVLTAVHEKSRADTPNDSIARGGVCRSYRQ